MPHGFDNVIQQFLIHQFMGHRDGPDNGHLHNNMRLIRKREAGEPFYAFVWDMEYSFVDVNDDLNVDFAPARDTLSVVYDALRAQPEFRMRYADLAHRYLFNDGALTTAPASSRYDVRAEFIEQAIIGESARWGDVLRNHLRPGREGPLAGMEAWSGYSEDYITSEQDISFLAGQNFRIRFRVGTDSSVYAVGWFVDNVQIYTCSPGGIALPVVLIDN